MSYERRFLFHLDKPPVQHSEFLFLYVANNLDIQDNAKEASKELRKNISRFCSKVSERWKAASHRKDLFYSKNETWLNEHVTLCTKHHQAPTHSSKMGRPSKEFEQGSERSKRRKTEKLRKNSSSSFLKFAAEMKSREEKAHGEESFHSTPTQPPQNAIALSDEEALSLFVDAGCTKNQYHLFQQSAKGHQANIYPSYKRVAAAKEKCYPPSNSIIITDTSAEVGIQQLLNHTVERIVEFEDFLLNQQNKENCFNISLVSKYGFDGSSSQAKYKQVFAEEGASDRSLFVSLMVPLQMYFLKEDGQRVIVWQNPKPSSTRFCRPIRLQFLKETPEVTLGEKEYLKSQIQSLQPTKAQTSAGIKIRVKHALVLTMIDGKVCSVLTNTSSSQTCNICKATPKNMNNLSKVCMMSCQDVNSFEYGLSTLHCWIRFMECVLHIAYRLDVQCWQVRKPEHKVLVEKRQATVKAEIRRTLNITVDCPKQGSGTTSDGNCARTFFADPQKAAMTTGVSEDLITRFSTILRAMSSSYAIDVQAFKNFCLETAKVFVETYKWYYMPASLHKVLIHGAEIISAAVLPIGMLSEEAQESRNKDCRNFRLQHTRKISREASNHDLFHRLLQTSDPLISSLKTSGHRSSSEPIPPNVLALLKEPAT